MQNPLTSLSVRRSRPSHRQRGPRWWARPALLVGLLGVVVAALLTALAAYLMVPRTEAVADRPRQDQGSPASTVESTSDPAPSSRVSRPRRSPSPTPTQAATPAATAEPEQHSGSSGGAPAPTPSTTTTTSSPLVPPVFPGKGNAKGHGKPER